MNEDYFKMNYFKYSGGELPYRISYLSLRAWQKETGAEVGKLNNIEENLSLVEPLFYHSVILGHEICSRKLVESREQLEMILDANWANFVGSIGDFFLEGETEKPIERMIFPAQNLSLIGRILMMSKRLARSIFRWIMLSSTATAPESSQSS